MPVPSLFPILMKAVASGNIVSEGTEFIETFGLEMLEMTDLELVDIDFDVEIVELAPDIEVLEVIDVEILC